MNYAYPSDLNKLVVAVTGHREIHDSDLPRLEHAVHECLAELESLRPSIPRLLICGLAEGADQLVAQCALDRGWSLKAILAMPLDEFAKTMRATAAYRLRNNFVPRCNQVIEMNAVGSSGLIGYQGVAHAICCEARWLIALWDGEPGRGPGSTAETVEWFLHGVPSQDNPRLPDAQVYWVKTCRQGELKLQGVIGEWGLLERESQIDPSDWSPQ